MYYEYSINPIILPFDCAATFVSHALSLPDALPIAPPSSATWPSLSHRVHRGRYKHTSRWTRCDRDRKEHTSELQSRGHLVCRLLLEKKKTQINRQSGARS